MEKLTIEQEQAAAYILCYYMYKFPGKQGQYYRAAQAIQPRLERRHCLNEEARQQIRAMGEFLVHAGSISNIWVQQLIAKEQEL